MVTNRNKFVYLANSLNISLEGLKIPASSHPPEYWEYEMKGEKMVTIFLHLLIEYLSKGFSIYSNHAGSERSYFLCRNGQPITIKKYIDRDAYKAGDKSKIVNLPDLIVCDRENNEILNIEGEQFKNVLTGIKQLQLFDAIEGEYIKPNYPQMPIKRTVVLFGGDSSAFSHVEVGFILTKSGDMEISLSNAPKIFETARNNLRDFFR